MAFPINARIFQLTILVIVIPNFGNTNADCPSCFDMLMKLFRLEHDQRIMMEKLEEQNNAIVALRQSATACLPVIRHMYLGCYVDKEDRLLDGEWLRSDNMTTKTCLDFCIVKGTRFFLTEFTSYCFCGNALKNYEKRPNTECNYVCAGDSNEMCGGYWRGSLYDIASASNKAENKSSANYTYIGCYEDKEDRLLEGGWVSDNKMTTARCLEICQEKGMRYFLTEYTSYCFCGNELKNYDKRPDSECDYACSGDDNEKCGGVWRGSLFSIGTGALNQSIGYVYLGCYVDKWDRLLEDVHIENQNMTTKMCLEFCVSKEMRFFLTEFYSHCFCGQKLKYIEKRPDSECNNMCSGNNTETCGGVWRGSVYDTEPVDR